MRFVLIPALVSIMARMATMRGAGPARLQPTHATLGVAPGRSSTGSISSWIVRASTIQSELGLIQGLPCYHVIPA